MMSERARCLLLVSELRKAFAVVRAEGPITHDILKHSLSMVISAHVGPLSESDRRAWCQDFVGHIGKELRTWPAGVTQ